jgi:acyl-CoA thioesterase I
MRQRAAIPFLALSLFSFGIGQVKVACIGNSITEGYGLTDARTEAYPARLKALLGNGYTVQNDGASGRTMLKSDARNSYWKFGKLGAALALKPDIVTIELGTNDANNFAGSWNTMGPEFKRDYLAMIDTFNVLAVKPKFFVIMPLPIRGNNDATLVKANALIKEVAQERGATLVDCYAPFTGKPQLYRTNDGLHPNAAGADTMAHILYRAMMMPTAAHPDSRRVASGGLLFPGFEGSSFPGIAKALAEGGRYRIRVFDNRGALLVSSDIESGSPRVDAIHARLKSLSGISWVAMDKLD